MREFVTRLLRLAMRLFFKRIELAGFDRVPAGVPVIFAANHPNGLVDPLFILCFAPRPVSFLAKAPLFRYPLIGYLVRILDTIPVYRKQDNTRGSNEETFSRAREVLRGGGSIAIFPEGTTHSDSKLRELKTGAARIALGAKVESLLVVPAGIYYTAKQTFRSEALVWAGEPIAVTSAPGPDGDEPPAAAVDALTAEIERQLAAVTLQADSHAALELISRAERIFSAGAGQPLAVEFELRRRFVDGYRYLREHDPEQLERLSSDVRQFECELGGARLDVDELTAQVDLRRLLRTIALFPVALIGAIVHFVPYVIVDALSKRFSREDELTATIKFVAALLFYPLTWLTVTFVIWRVAGAWAACATLLLIPLAGYAAVRVMEHLDELTGISRSLLFRLRAGSAHAALVTHRQRIRDRFVSVAEVIHR
jgi:glycerol-3-phosphate O-acyltransferase / dihydroxyacetone phosphate acyltransferase